MPRVRSNSPLRNVARCKAEAMFPQLWDGIGPLWYIPAGLNGTTVMDFGPYKMTGTLSGSAVATAGQSTAGLAAVVCAATTSNGWTFTDSTNFCTPGTSDYTFAAWMEPTGTSSGIYVVWGWNSSRWLGWFQNTMGFDGSGDSAGGTYHNAGLRHFLWTRYLGSKYLYVNGVATYSGGADSVNSNTNNATSVGYWNGAGFPTNAKYVEASYHNRGTSAGEARLRYQLGPGGILTPRRKLYVGVAAAVGNRRRRLLAGGVI